MKRKNTESKSNTMNEKTKQCTKSRKQKCVCAKMYRNTKHMQMFMQNVVQVTAT